MSRQVSLDEKAIHQATAFLADDHDGLRALLTAVDMLTTEPYPEGLSRSARPGCTACASAGYRVLYTVTDDLISVGHIARTARDA